MNDEAPSQPSSPMSDVQDLATTQTDDAAVEPQPADAQPSSQSTAADPTSPASVQPKPTNTRSLSRQTAASFTSKLAPLNNVPASASSAKGKNPEPVPFTQRLLSAPSRENINGYRLRIEENVRTMGSTIEDLLEGHSNNDDAVEALASEVSELRNQLDMAVGHILSAQDDVHTMNDQMAILRGQFQSSQATNERLEGILHTLLERTAPPALPPASALPDSNPVPSKRAREDMQPATAAPAGARVYAAPQVTAPNAVCSAPAPNTGTSTVATPVPALVTAGATAPTPIVAAPAPVFTAPAPAAAAAPAGSPVYSAPAPHFQRRGNNGRQGRYRAGAWVALGKFTDLGTDTAVLSSQFDTTLGFLVHPDTGLFIRARRQTGRGCRILTNKTHVAGYFDDQQMAADLVAAWTKGCPPSWAGLTAEIVEEPPFNQSSASIVPNRFYTVSIRSWNVNGLARLIKNKLPIRLQDHDVNILQETHLVPGQEESLDVPAGYEMKVLNRPAGIMARQGGGLAIIYRTDIFQCCDVHFDMYATEVMSIDLGFITIVNAYHPPDSSPWNKWSDMDPIDQIAEAVGRIVNADRPLLLAGDFNARIGAEQACDPGIPRRSQDSKVNPRGRELIAMLSASGLSVLNGLESFDPSSQAWTSFRASTYNRTLTVVDYAACSADALPFLLDMHIADRKGLSDHAPLVIELAVPGDMLKVDRVAVPAKERTRRVKRELPRNTDLDIMYADAVAAARKSTPEAKLRKLYGSPTTSSKEYVVYTDGSCHGNGTSNARAGAGVYWGPANARNRCLRVPGRPQTNNRGEIFAVLTALSLCRLDKSLVIFTDSQYTIHSLYHWAAALADTGWTCKNGDLLRDCAEWLRARSAPTRLEYVRGHANNAWNIAADGNANTGADLPDAGEYVRIVPHTEPVFGPERPPLDVPKVSTSLPPSPNPHARLNLGRRPQWGPKTSGHRGRDLKRWKKDLKLAMLISSRVSQKKFWGTYRRLMDPLRKPPKVSLNALHGVFKKRMNKPAVPPATFSRTARVAAHARAQNLAAIVPTFPPDDTFTRDFDLGDIAGLKADIKASANSGTPGFDGITKSLVMDMENEDLVTLFNECVRRRDAPSVWLRTVVIGIMKKGLPEYDANSYRTIGLECVVLKLLTLLIHKRLYDWAERMGILPPSQNGFRHEFRTNNNVFILRTILEKYEPTKRPVYVAFIDISNAFPSTDRDLLFVKLQRMGCIGPIIDWLRHLYREMNYVVELEGAYSDEFKSDIGVLIGDPSSPTLWNLFLSDFCPPAHADDPILAGVRVPIVFHADDMMGLNLGHDGMQALLSYAGRYAARNQLVAHALKTKMMIVGPIPNHPTVFHLQGARIDFVKQADYVGVPLSSTAKNFFDLVYPRAAEKAHRAAIAITGARTVVGRLRPADAKTLYDARVDCYLILAADVVIDLGTHLDALEHVQHAFCRRVLGLRKRSMIVPLFTELGLVPIRFRRLKLALRFLRYVAMQPAGRYVRLAMQEAILMYDVGIPSWIGDLAYALRRLPHRIVLPSTQTLWDPATADELMRLLEASLKAELQDAIQDSSRLYLLRDRTEPQKRGPARKTVLQFRHYLLSIADDDDRIAFTKLLVSDHPFALEQFRWESTRNGIRKLKVPREDRLCRLCGLAVESPEHALLVCKGVRELVDARDKFAEQVRTRCPSFVERLPSADAEAVLVALISTAELAPCLAAFTKTVFTVFDSYALDWPVSYTERVGENDDDD